MADNLPDGFFRVNIARLRESLESLADDIEFIASGNADDPGDFAAWEHRTNAGVQFVRLRAALNNGQLDRADCDLATLDRVRSVWVSLKRLRYGSHHDQPDKYCGALFLPGEVGPLDKGLPFRKADEPYDTHEELKGCLSRETLYELYSDESWESLRGNIPDRMIDGMRKTLNSQTTKRAEWSRFPAELRRLSVRMEPKAENAAEVNAKPLRLVKRDSKTEARDKWIYEQVCAGVAYSAIRSKLKTKPKGWGRLSADNGVKAAANRYAERHNLSLPMPRKAGRPSK